MRVAYFPGCSLHAMAREYDRSTRLVCGRLGIELAEVDDWNCCGATAAHSLNHLLAVALGARNLAQVAKMGLGTVVSPCAGCSSRLRTAAHELSSSPALRTRTLELIEEAELPEVRALHLLELLAVDSGLEAVSAAVTRPLRGLRVAAYYGCLLTRPSAIARFDDPEQPVFMDRLLQALGAEPVRWGHKAECCGGGFAVSEPGIVQDLGGQVLAAARSAGAEAVVVACPMCQGNLDSRQREMLPAGPEASPLPVLYFTQLMALAFGCSSRQAGLHRLLVDPRPWLRRAGVL